jgi:nucleotide-binding universal stress UspA family protein
MYSHILAPVDGSQASNRGLREAIRLAKDQKAKLLLLHVVDESMLTLDMYGVLNWGDVIAALREGGMQLIEQAKALAASDGVQAQGVVVETLGQRVADKILREARDRHADIIVMGTHGRRGFRHLVLGSDAEAVLHEARTPVLLVRPDTAETPATS